MGYVCLIFLILKYLLYTKKKKLNKEIKILLKINLKGQLRKKKQNFPGRYQFQITFITVHLI